MKHEPIAAITAPEAHLLRRYISELLGPEQSDRGTVAPGQEEEARLLYRYLEPLGLVPPYWCRLTGVRNLRSLADLAAHLLSEEHKARRERLRLCAELLDEVRRGDVPLTDWLPKHAQEYRNVLDWCDHRFQEFLTKDGRVFSFDHLTGLGGITPESEWEAGRPPPALVVTSNGAASPAGPGTGGGSQIWPAGGPRRTPVAAPLLVGSTDELLAAVQRSLASSASPAPHAWVPTKEDLPPKWVAETDTPSGYVYYYHTGTMESSWTPPPLVEVGETWRTNPRTRARDTPQELYQRMHNISARPERAVP